MQTNRTARNVIWQLYIDRFVVVGLQDFNNSNNNISCVFDCFQTLVVVWLFLCLYHTLDSLAFLYFRISKLACSRHIHCSYTRPTLLFGLKMQTYFKTSFSWILVRFQQQAAFCINLFYSPENCTVEIMLFSVTFKSHVGSPVSR